jgi:hypothetical protein
MTCTSFEHDANLDLETGVLECPTSLEVGRSGLDQESMLIRWEPPKGQGSDHRNPSGGFPAQREGSEP